MITPTLLIDSNYMAHAAKHSMKGLKYEDIPTGIIYGFLSRIVGLSEEFKTNDFVFFWDSKKSHRKRKYPWYKEKRKKKTSEELKLDIVAYEQFDILKNEILPLMGFRNIIMQTGFESDDTIAKTVINHIGNFIVVGCDTDLYQLLNYCDIYNPIKKEIFTKNDLLMTYNCNPEEWVLVKQIAGCKSDEIPGVSGVGEITAVKYLRGELKTESKAFNAIQEQGDIIQRNEWLIKLPLSGTKEIIFEINDLSENSFELFLDMCETYDMQSFKTGKGYKNWFNFYNGKFFDKSKDLIKNRMNRSKRKK